MVDEKHSGLDTWVVKSFHWSITMHYAGVLIWFNLNIFNQI